jgi:hypothetical protein
MGAIGQYWFFEGSFNYIPEGVVAGVLSVPWLMLFIITFLKIPPFGRRQFRFCLLFIMCWYTAVTGIAEILYLFVHLPFDEHVSVVAAQIMMYSGFFCYIPLIRAYIKARPA